MNHNNERKLDSQYRGFSLEDLNKFFYFNLDSGVLYHKRRDILHFSDKLNPLLSVNAWNSRWADKPAGNINGTTGYLKVKLNGVNLANHRIIYLMANGWIDDKLFIDHIDGNKINNKPSNLRLVDQAENSQNQRKAQSSSILGVLGVSITSSGKHQARIGVDSKDLYLGSFDTIDEASNAYQQAKKKLHIDQPTKP